MHRSRTKWTGRDSGHHGLPVVGRTARGGGTHGRAPGSVANFAVSRVAFRLSAVFALFLPYNTHVPGHLRQPIHTQ